MVIEPKIKTDKVVAAVESGKARRYDNNNHFPKSPPKSNLLE
jgi:hypothetical protein